MKMKSWWRIPSLLAVGAFWVFISPITFFESISAVRVYDEARLQELREEVRSVFYHGYDNYIQHAYPYDELRPLSCDGVDTWGSYSLTLIDTLDTLAVIGNYSEFRRVAQLVIDNAHFDLNINVSVFETNIRIIGGLLSAHLLSQKAGMEVEPGWPCSGPLLRLAEVVARKILPAFDTATGMPYGTVNLRYGVPPNETPVTCTAGVGTFIVEFGALSALIGDPIYEKVALKAIHSLYSKRSVLDLVGNHIDTQTGKWTAVDSGIGAGVDSFFEYLVKGSILFEKPELMHMFKIFHSAIEKHLGKGGWYVWATMGQGHVSATTFQSLETFYPGMLSLVGEFKSGLRAMANYHRILKQYGGLPELYSILQGKATHQREGYPLRPELIESAMYLYRATGDPYMLEIGEDILHSIQSNAKTECGYATIRDVTTLTLEDRMESFFLAETVKYLYLLFDPNNFIHSEGDDVTVVDNPLGKCTVYAGGYIFNTEAHPIDPSALHCCTGVRESELHKEIEIIDEIRSPRISTKQKKSNDKRAQSHKQSQKKSRKVISTLTESESISDAEIALKLAGSGSRAGNNLNSESETWNVNLNPQELKSYKTNPLLAFQNNITPVSAHKIELNMSKMLDNMIAAAAVDGNKDKDDSKIIELLQKLLENDAKYQDITNNHATVATAGKNSNYKGLTITSESTSSSSNFDAKDLQKLVESFETNLKLKSVLQAPTGTKTAPNQNQKAPSAIGAITKLSPSSTKKLVNSKSKDENRILTSDQGDPDMDLIFGTGATGRSLSFYFSLKWLRTFPDLLRQLIPSETFDLQKFYGKMTNEFTSEGFASKYNITPSWMSDYNALRCPSLKMADRFMFFRSSADD